MNESPKPYKENNIENPDSRTSSTGNLQYLTEMLDREKKYAKELLVQVEGYKTLLEEMRASWSWKITYPLREVLDWMLMPGKKAKSYLVVLLKGAKSLYYAMPFSEETRLAHFKFLVKRMPKLLMDSGTRPDYIYRFIRRPDAAFLYTALEEGEPNLPGASYGQIGHDESTPLVTVILLCTEGRVDTSTLARCIQSIRALQSSIPFDVVVVHSGNFVSDVPDLKGVRMYSQPPERKAGVYMTEVVQKLRGRYLLFLDVHGVPTRGWIEELLRTYEEFPQTGVVGSRSMDVDGKLYEAGGIAYSDGSMDQYGRLDYPDLPKYNYAREVDFCSPLSLMIEKTLFLDSVHPDIQSYSLLCFFTSICFEIRQRGYKVIYQPLSLVCIGKDSDKEGGIYAMEGTRLCDVSFRERYSAYLRSKPSKGRPLDFYRDTFCEKKMLVLDHCTPTPDEDAGSVTCFNMLVLARDLGFKVTFIPEDNFLYMPAHTQALQRRGIEVIYAPYEKSVKGFIEKAKEEAASFDLVFIFRPIVFQRHYQTIRSLLRDAKILYETVDIHYIRMEREADLLKDAGKKAEAERMREIEFHALNVSDAAIILSSGEMAILRPLLPAAKMFIFPLILDVCGTNVPFSERRDIVFVGSYNHKPNVDAVLYFAREIMPLLREILPGVCFVIVGTNAPEEIVALQCEDMVYKGFVKDLNALYDSVRVAVAPLRYGAGIKGKVGTAMAAGLPVVASAIAVEGMELVPDCDVLVSDTPMGFALKIKELYNEPSLWNQLSVNGIATAQRLWGAVAAKQTLANIVSEAGVPIDASASGDVIPPLFDGRL